MKNIFLFLLTLLFGLNACKTTQPNRSESMLKSTSQDQEYFDFLEIETVENTVKSKNIANNQDLKLLLDISNLDVLMKKSQKNIVGVAFNKYSKGYAVELKVILSKNGSTFLDTTRLFPTKPLKNDNHIGVEFASKNKTHPTVLQLFQKPNKQLDLRVSSLLGKAVINKGNTTYKLKDELAYYRDSKISIEDRKNQILSWAVAEREKKSSLTWVFSEMLSDLKEKDPNISVWLNEQIDNNPLRLSNNVISQFKVSLNTPVKKSTTVAGLRVEMYDSESVFPIAWINKCKELKKRQNLVVDREKWIKPYIEIPDTSKFKGYEENYIEKLVKNGKWNPFYELEFFLRKNGENIEDIMRKEVQ